MVRGTSEAPVFLRWLSQAERHWRGCDGLPRWRLGNPASTRLLLQPGGCVLSAQPAGSIRSSLPIFAFFATSPRTRRCEITSTDVNYLAARTLRMPNYRPPMPLTAFEEYMFRDDRPTHPMSIVFRLRFSGALNRDAASVAWSQTIGRHALLRSTILAVGNRRPCWIALKHSRHYAGPANCAGDMPEMEPIDLVTGAGSARVGCQRRPPERNHFTSPCMPPATGRRWSRLPMISSAATPAQRTGGAAASNCRRATKPCWTGGQHLA